jgi:hypothetical protein
MPLDNDDIKQLIAILQKGLTTEEVDDEEVDTSTSSTQKRGRPKTKTKKVSTPKSKTEPSRARKTSTNLFDTMSEKSMFKSDVAIDKKLNKLPPSPRSRKANMIEVRCRVCGDKEKVSSDFVFDKARYKCNGCAMNPG